MPAMLDDPTSSAIIRFNGDSPKSDPTSLPLDLHPRLVMLRDRVTQATLVPFSSVSQVPLTLIAYLCNQLNREIEKGDTYPMADPLPLEAFGPYWFANFGAIMLLGEIMHPDQVMQMEQRGCDWEKECLGSFYIKPNYPGRSSHVCNGGFLVTDGARNRGVGRLMGEGYLEYAPKLGYLYSVFNLVYETNTPSCRIWDALGFKRIGRVKGCGNLKSYPGQLIDSIIYGRDLKQEGEDVISEERFDRIKFYLKHQRYPDGADRAEKSRLRSASTHYKLIPASDTEPEKLMLKGKEVISDPQVQYDVARRVHMEQHGGINKTTAIITEKFHWVRIKDTVTQVIKNCNHCKEAPQRAIAPYGRRETHPKKTTIPPFDREFSVPPGERALTAHGYSNTESDMNPPVRAVTPGAFDDEEPTHELRQPSVQDDLDAEAAPETADHFAGFMETDLSFPEFGNDGVPVDPELTNGLQQPTNFEALEQEVRRLQRNQVFGSSIFEPKESTAQPEIESVTPDAPRRSSRRMTAGGTGSPDPSQLGSNARKGVQAQAPAGDELLDVVQFNAMVSQPVQGGAKKGAKRQHQGESTEEFRRVTRRVANSSTSSTPASGRTGHVSEDAWRQQLSEQGGS